MRISKVFTFFAASYFALVFIKDGTLLRLTNDISRGVKTLLRGSRKLTRLT